MTRHVQNPLDIISPVVVTRYREVDTVVGLEIRSREVRLPLHAMRCVVCGHRLDDMDGCDSCASDLEAAEWEKGDDDDGAA